jgi:hypothetical protein
MRRTTIASVAAVVLAALLPALYMGAYYKMLDVPHEFRAWERERKVIILGPNYSGDAPDSLEDTPAIDAFFLPAHQIDRLIRPSLWNLRDDTPDPFWQ